MVSADLRWYCQDMRRIICAVLILVCLLPGGMLAWRYRAMAHLGWLDDDGIYAVTAKALAEGRGYVLDHLPASPPQTKYPPLYPAYLALFWRGGMPVLLAAQYALLPLLATLAWFWWRRQGFGLPVSTAMASFLVLNPFTIALSASLMSEVLFTCLLLASVLCARRPGLSGLLGGLAYLTRIVALPLLAAAPLLYWLRGDRRAALRFVPGMAPWVAGWHAWCFLHRSSSPDPVAAYYTNYLGVWFANLTWVDVPSLLYANGAALLAALSGLFTFGAGEDKFSALVFRLFAFASVAGCLRLIRRNGLDPLYLYGLGLTALLAVWNYPPHERFVWPLLPLLLAGLACELASFRQMVVQAFRGGKRLPAVICGCAASCLIVVAVGRNAVALWHDVPMTFASVARAEPARRSASTWLRGHLDPQSRLATSNGAKTYLDSGFRGYTPRVPTRFYHRDDRAAFVDYFRRLPEFARENHLSYILITPDEFRLDLKAAEAKSVRSALAARTDLTRLYADGDNVVYRVEPR